MTRSEGLIKSQEESFVYTARYHTGVVLSVQEHRRLIDSLPEDNFYFQPSLEGLWLSCSGNSEFLLNVLNRIKDAGYHPHPENKVSDELQTEWTGRFSAGGTPVILQFVSTVCKKVQVGTRTVEEPIYEIRCDSQSAEPTGIDLANGPMPTEVEQPSSLEPFITEHEDDKIPF